MLTPFDRLSDTSRIWVYQADRPLTADEQSEILENTLNFISKWAAHGQDLQAAATIRYNQILIIGADESFNMASGCSIDSSVHFVQQLGDRFSIDFFDRMKLGFLINETVKIMPLSEIKASIERQEIDKDSLFFQNTITAKKELEGNWLVKAGESWLKRYFNVHESV